MLVHRHCAVIPLWSPAGLRPAACPGPPPRGHPPLPHGGAQRPLNATTLWGFTQIPPHDAIPREHWHCGRAAQAARFGGQNPPTGRGMPPSHRVTGGPPGSLPLPLPPSAPAPGPLLLAGVLAVRLRPQRAAVHPLHPLRVAHPPRHDRLLPRRHPRVPRWGPRPVAEGGCAAVCRPVAHRSPPMPRGTHPRVGHNAFLGSSPQTSSCCVRAARLSFCNGPFLRHVDFLSYVSKCLIFPHLCSCLTISPVLFQYSNSERYSRPVPPAASPAPTTRSPWG